MIENVYAIKTYKIFVIQNNCVYFYHQYLNITYTCVKKFYVFSRDSDTF